MTDKRPPVDLFDVTSYSFDLPEELIAQNPSERRDGSRLMAVARESGPKRGAEPSHMFFSDLPGLLMPGDLLVMNDTRVFRARLAGKKIPGGASAEIFCLSQRGDDPREWRALVRPGGKLPPGTEVALPGGAAVTIGERLGDGLRLIRLPRDTEPSEMFERLGQVPLPPYIRHGTVLPERYQTVYAKRENDRSVAAPTAGLHFTGELLARLEDAGIGREFITLDVGLGTFRPVKERDVRNHKMHAERCRVGENTALRVNEARRSGRRIVAVGTTTARTLESMADDSGSISAGEKETDIFIRPGYRFKAIDALITNFHLPESTLLMLVSAFAGHETTMKAYALAVKERYRFFSFGDAMLIE
ncbi:MAG: tRNA preQ1(34) S-adenosylmethionine ribosyltransferase-isomerase QueA [Synergistaceae bacterium]|jgi:S-adenosylmethionine:tRNA ribosyltransferase-isomerase|nr:tRNA preQ1(34) S-adenosylmethionine ribosyltransferase-isomerase QueA [Synergistaceae bacterium]